MKSLLVTATTIALTLGGAGLVRAQEHGHEPGHQDGHRPMMQNSGMSDRTNGHMRMMVNTELSPRDPAALLAMQEGLDLSNEQVEKLQALIEQTRREAAALLNDAQRGQLEQMPEQPQSMMQMHRQMMQGMKGMHGDNGKGMCPMCTMMMKQHDSGAAQPDARIELDAKSQAALDQIVASYLAVQTRLAEDQTQRVVAQLTELHDAAHALFKADSAKVQEQARAVAETVHSQPENLDEARKVFKALSAEVIELTDLALPGDDIAPALYQVHCPMAEASWLQTGKEIVNPYMGQEMLRCGEIQRTVKGPEQE